MSVSYIKVEKSNAIFSSKRLQTITILFRFMEICIVIFIFSSFSTYLQIYSTFSLYFWDFFPHLSTKILSPGFFFVVGNMIILILFSNYGKFLAQESTSSDIYSKYLDIQENNDTGEIKKQGRLVSSDLYNSEVSKLQRSKSEVLVGYQYHDEDSCSRVAKSYRKSVSYNYERMQAEMSCDEFRQMVEGFIARQQRNLREEEPEEVY